MRHGKTAVYTILKNEVKNIERWLYYAAPFDYQVLLDTGSTDGSWELLQQYTKQYPNLIIEQVTFNPWIFSVARNYNLAMVPKDTAWCLSPDLDEYFSINTHDEMEKIIGAVPDITNIACDRLDIYSQTVRVGPPNFIPTNKIHKYGDYTWVQPIYEHLRWIYPDRDENELYSDDIYLIHDQDFKKQERPGLYISMLEEEYRVNPTNSWCLWFLVYHYYKSHQLDKYIPAACDFLNCHGKKDDWYKSLVVDLNNLIRYEQLPPEQHERIFNTLLSNGELC